MALSDEQIESLAFQIVGEHIKSIEYLDIVETVDEEFPDVEWEMAESGDYGKVSSTVEKILEDLRNALDKDDFGGYNERS